jgi:hypothetical protein
MDKCLLIDYLKNIILEINQNIIVMQEEYKDSMEFIIKLKKINKIMIVQ